MIVHKLFGEADDGALGLLLGNYSLGQFQLDTILQSAFHVLAYAAFEHRLKLKFASH